MGVLAGTSAKDFSRISKNRRRYLSAGQEPNEEYSFLCLGPLTLTEKSFELANSEINLDAEKLKAAFFWFYSKSEVDIQAIEALKAGDKKQCEEIWRTHTKENASESFNLSTLLLCRASTLELSDKVGLFIEATGLKLNFIEGKHFTDFKQAVTDITFQTTPIETQVAFLQLIWIELEKQNINAIKQWLKAINELKYIAKEKFTKWLTETLIQNIENKIESTGNQRRLNNALSLQFGEALLENTIKQLDTLELLLTKKNAYYIGITDKVAEEVLQCAKNYFTLHENNLSTTELAEKATVLAKKAEKIAFGHAAKENNKTFIKNVAYWIEDLPGLRKKQLVQEDYDAVEKLLDNFENLERIGKEEINILIHSAKPYLKKIKDKLDDLDEFYLTISSNVIRLAQNKIVALNELFADNIIKIVNILNQMNRVDNYTYYIPTNLKKELIDFQLSIRYLYEQLTTLLKMDMVDNLRDTVAKNRKGIREMANKLNEFTGSSYCINSDDYDNISKHYLKERHLKNVYKLTDQTKLTELAKTANDSDVRLAAVNRITNQVFLIDIAKTAKHNDARIAAIKRITDQAVLLEISKTANDPEVRKAAVKKITDKAKINEIIQTSDDKDVVKTAEVKKRNQPLRYYWYAVVVILIVVASSKGFYWYRTLEQTQNIPSTIVDPFQDNMVLVPGGTFQMGCTPEQKNCFSNEKPVHKVTIDSFYLSKYEVTQVQWKMVMGSNPSMFSGCDSCPVESVSWQEVQAFIVKLKQLTGNTYRLPTEAEWEYAARGGKKLVASNKKTKNYMYAGNNNLNEVAWYSENSSNKTQPVGKREPNELGLYDMNGNVWEWCQDWYNKDFYRNSPENNPRGPLTGNFHIIRGGSWFSAPHNCRVSVRDFINLPEGKSHECGFRLYQESVSH